MRFQTLVFKSECKGTAKKAHVQIFWQKKAFFGKKSCFVPLSACCAPLLCSVKGTNGKSFVLRLMNEVNNN